jgi:hypothetical protein
MWRKEQYIPFLFLLFSLSVYFFDKFYQKLGLLGSEGARLVVLALAILFFYIGLVGVFYHKVLERILQPNSNLPKEVKAMKENLDYSKRIDKVNKGIIYLIVLFLSGFIVVLITYPFNKIQHGYQQVLEVVWTFISYLFAIVFYISFPGILILLGIKGKIKKQNNYKGADIVDVKLKQSVERFFTRGMGK